MSSSSRWLCFRMWTVFSSAISWFSRNYVATESRKYLQETVHVFQLQTVLGDVDAEGVERAVDGGEAASQSRREVKRARHQRLGYVGSVISRCRRTTVPMNASSDTPGREELVSIFPRTRIIFSSSSRCFVSHWRAIRPHSATARWMAFTAFWSTSRSLSTLLITSFCDCIRAFSPSNPYT